MTSPDSMSAQGLARACLGEQRLSTHTPQRHLGSVAMMPRHLGRRQRVAIFLWKSRGKDPWISHQAPAARWQAAQDSKRGDSIYKASEGPDPVFSSMGAGCFFRKGGHFIKYVTGCWRFPILSCLLLAPSVL